MSQEYIPVDELWARAEPLPVGVDPATALIAVVPPKLLREATTAKLYTTELDAETAEQQFEAALQHPSSPKERRRAREGLEKVLANRHATEAPQHTPLDVMALADDIDLRKGVLTKPIRRLSAAICAVALGSSLGYAAAERITTLQHQKVTNTIRQNHTLPPDKRHKVPPESLNNKEVGVAAFLGLVSGISGGLLVNTTGTTSLGDGLAQRRARRSVRLRT